MKLPWLFGCIANQHEPVRKQVKSDAEGFFGNCRHCGEPIRRHAHGDWRREVDPEAA